MTRKWFDIDVNIDPSLLEPEDITVTEEETEEREEREWHDIEIPLEGVTVEEEEERRRRPTTYSHRATVRRTSTKTYQPTMPESASVDEILYALAPLLDYYYINRLTFYMYPRKVRRV